MNRVIVTRPMLGICTMQVCAVSDATDEEILDVCNRENFAGTTNGWVEVIRSVDPDDSFRTEKALPVTCEECADRTHFLVVC